MKKLIFVLLLAGAGYTVYTKLSQTNSGAFDEQGNAQVLLFTVNTCGKPCKEATRMLDKRGVEYEEVVVTDGEAQEKRWEQFGAITKMPVLVAGNEQVAGYHKWDYVAALALNFDRDHLTVSEDRIFEKNFTPEGEPKLVMYTMDGCGYCEAAISDLRDDGIHFEERNISNDTTARDEIEKLQSGTPLIYYGYRRFEGWSGNVHNSLLSALEQKGV